jgi:purine-nucleoside phosphorylase
MHRKRGGARPCPTEHLMIESTLYKQQVDEATAWLQKRLTAVPRIALVLGTGLGEMATALEVDRTIAYRDIPHFPQTTATDHAGKLLFGRIYGLDVAVMQGRFHYYEGYSAKEITFPVRVFARLGTEILVITNAAGGLNSAFAPGTIMLIEDHLNFIGDNPLRGPNIEEWGPRFPDFSQPYDRDLIGLAESCVRRLGMDAVVSGTYIAVPGPGLETPAETRFYRNCGADAIGMSTVPEVMAARHAGMKVLGLSLIANVNDPDNFQPIVAAEVIARVKETAPRLQKLVLAVLLEIATKTYSPSNSVRLYRE